MKCTILRWLLGIWLVEIVAARHIQNGEEQTIPRGRSSRDQYHRQPFYGMGQTPHLSYSSFRSSMRRTPPQSPHRRNLVEQDPSFASNNGENEHEFGTNYFFSNDQQLHPYQKNQQNLNVYSAVRLHGALEARAKAEPGSPTLLSQNHHYSNFNHPPQFRQPERQWRRGNEQIDGESDEGGNADDLARFSLYNSYFDNEHSIKALNSMKCVTPTGSPGFCSTFRGCVPSFFTNDGELEAPALAELISTSIGYCTTNVSHHFIREQRQQFQAISSREERRFNSVANRIICCPGVAPIRDPNQDPDKIFNDYIEAQKNRLKTTTTTTTSTTTTTTTTAVPPSESPAVDEGVDAGVSNDAVDQQPDVSNPPVSEGPAPISEGQTGPGESSLYPEGQAPSSTMHPPSSSQPESSSAAPEASAPEGSAMYPGAQAGSATSEYPMYPSSSPAPGQESVSESSSASPGIQQSPETSSQSSASSSNSSVPEPSPVSDDSSVNSVSQSPPESAPMYPGGSAMYPGGQSPSSSAPDATTYPEQSSSTTPSMYPEGQSPTSATPDESMYPVGQPSSSSAPDSMSQEGQPAVSSAPNSSMYPEGQSPSTSTPSSIYPEGQPSSSTQNSMYPEGQPSTSSSDSSMYPEGQQPSSPASPMYPESGSPSSPPDSSMYPGGQSPIAPAADQPAESDSAASSSISGSVTESVVPVDSSSSSPSSMYPEPVPSSEAPSMPMYPNTENPASEISNAPVSSDSASMYPSSESPKEEVAGSHDSSMYPSTGSPSAPVSSEPVPTSMYPEQSQSASESSSSPSSMYPSESESLPSMDEAEAPQQNVDSIPVSSSVSPPVEEQSTSTDASSSSSPPGTQDPQSPGKSTDSPIIKIKPEPVQGSNGKFTLPGGLYIVSSSTDHPHSNQNQVRPSSGGSETMVDSMPIFIVTNPSVVHMMPQFPSDYPPMGQEPAAPIDDSSLELQRPRPSTTTTSTTTTPPSSAAPEAVSEPVVTTTAPVQDAPEQAQQDESSPITTVLPVSQNDQASGDVTTNLPLSDSEDDEAVGAFTVVPVRVSSTPKSNQSSTTEVPQASGGADNIAATETSPSLPPASVDSGVQSVQEVQPDQAGSNLDITTISSVQSVGSQEVEVTTIRPVSVAGSAGLQEATVSGVSGAAGAVAGSSQENIQTTPGYIAATTPHESEESDESSEEVRATPSDDQKTTLAPSAVDENENDFAAVRTTTMLPSVGVNGVVQEDESMPTQPPASSGIQSVQAVEQEATTQGGSIIQQDQPEVSSSDQLAETQQPFPESSPAPSGGQQLFPDSQQQPFPDSEPATTEQTPVSNDDQQPVREGGSDGQVPSSEASSSTQVPSESDVGESASVPTTGAPVSGISEQQSSTEPVPHTDGAPAANDQPSGDNDGEGDVESSPIGGNEPAGGISESSTVSGSQTSVPSGSESATEGSPASSSGNDSSISGDDPGSTSSPVISSSVSPGSESLVSSSPASNNEPSVPAESSTSSSDQSSASEAASTSAPESPEVVPSNDEPVIPAVDNSDSVSTSQSSVSPSSTTTTVIPPTESSTGGDSQTENIPQENVPQVPSESPEDASPVQGSPPQADGPVSSDSMQDPQPVISTSEAPQNVSTDAPVDEASPSSEAMYQTSTVAPLEPVVTPEDIQPNYQILKACKFQSFFRSVNDMNYSYRHYPWLATIVGGTRPFSSGTLITDRHILTASHFLSNITVSDVFNMRIHIGYRTSYSGQTEGPYAVRKVRKVIRHKGFSFEKLYNDVAVLVLDRPVRFSEDIYPVCISSSSRAYADGTAEAFETGWIEDPRTYTISQHHNYIDPHIQKYFSFGYKNITWRLQEAPQRVRTNLECQSNYGFLEKNGIMVTDSMVCAGSGDTRSCAFRGNSGAPLFMRNENDRMTEQIGIVSWGIGCGHFPFVFTRVEAFLPWLDRVVYNSR